MPRPTAKMKDQSDLQQIPGVGPSIARTLQLVGIRRVADLKGRDPERLYQSLIRKEGRHIDRCVLYIFRLAVYYASTPERNHDPDKLLWWNWMDAARIQSSKRKKGASKWRGSKRSTKTKRRAN